jgi:hypothetical protein
MKLELTIGPGREAAFDSDEERRLAWDLHRDELMVFGNRIPGSRPWGWWRYESPEPLDDAVIDLDEPEGWRREARQLLRLGIMDAEETATLQGCWATEDRR